MRLEVVAAVIRGPGGVLLSRRQAHQHQGGLWEFPGGKLEPGETPRAALERELREELGIEVSEAQPLLTTRHAYPDREVCLRVWEVTAFEGEPQGLEGQPLAWVTTRDLPGYAFPEANLPILMAARLPDTYLITPADLSPPELLGGVRQALAQGAKLLQLRAPNMFDPAYRELAADIQGLCAGRAQLMLKGPLEWLGDFPAAGWHLTAEQLRRYAAQGRPFPQERWLAASCHSAQELQLAEQIGADFVTLSPVLPTASHPGEPTLGWAQTQALLEGFGRPAYLLGGLRAADVAQARACGARGVAGIRAFWPALQALPG